MPVAGIRRQPLHGERMAAPITDAEWLAWMAKLFYGWAEPPRESLLISPDSYCCLLDEQPTHLVPQRLLRHALGALGSSQVIFNPRCHLSICQDGVAVFSGSPDALPAPDIGSPSTAWVEDPTTRAWSPFWLSSALTSTIVGLRRDPAQILSLDTATRRTLQLAQILIAESATSDRPQLWSQTADRARSQFATRGYVPIGHLIHPFSIGALRRYFRRQIRKGKVRLGDDQSSRRYAAHNDPVARFFHFQLTKAVSDLAGETVKPSYVYMASYQSGAHLEKHTDREQCEYSITLCLDFTPEPEGTTTWPLRLDTKDGTVTVYQALGDGLLYRGRELTHYRGTLAEGHTSTSIFFHYVSQHFRGTLA